MKVFPLGHEEAPANLNEKDLMEPLLDSFLGDDIEVELVVGDSQLESPRVFRSLEERRIEHIIVWRSIDRDRSHEETL